jgi:hypothetical protein
MPASAPLKTTTKTVELTRIEFMIVCAFSGLDESAYGTCQSAAVNKSEIGTLSLLACRQGDVDLEQLLALHIGQAATGAITL